MPDENKKMLMTFVNGEIAFLSCDTSAGKAEKAVWRHAYGLPVCEDIRAWGLLQRDLPASLKWKGDSPGYAENAAFLALSAYAACGKDEKGLAFGTAAALLGERQRGRFTRLENSADTETLFRNVKDIIRLMTSKNGAGLDYGCLAADLYDWQFNRIGTARKWERDYYRNIKSKGENDHV